MKLQFKVTFKSGPKIVAEVVGLEGGGNLTIADVSVKIIETEQFLEKLTGLRCHIDQVG